MKTEMEFWYDPNHTGALRIIDHNKGLIYGSDPKEPYWIVSFETLKKDTLIVINSLSTFSLINPIQSALIFIAFWKGHFFSSPNRVIFYT